MPPAPARRQPEKSAGAWFGRASSRSLVHEVQRQVVPELTRVFGQTGLYLRPSVAAPAALSGNMLADVVSVARVDRGFAGDVACSDDALPFASGTLSLVYALFVFESSPAPAALLAEIARVLKPEGTALLLTLNPWSPARLRWAFSGLRAFDPVGIGARVRDCGLEVQRSRFVGARWSAPSAIDILPHPDSDSRLRMASLLVARRRDPGLTPLRAGSPALGFRPGISPG